MVMNKRGQKRKRRSKRYAAEFKENAVKLALRGNKPTSAVADELGVPTQTLYAWVSEYERAHGTAEREGESLEARVKRLERENERLREEREILKKAATFFAKESE